MKRTSKTSWPPTVRSSTWLLSVQKWPASWTPTTLEEPGSSLGWTNLASAEARRLPHGSPVHHIQPRRPPARHVYRFEDLLHGIQRKLVVEGLIERGRR